MRGLGLWTKFGASWGAEGAVAGRSKRGGPGFGAVAIVIVLMVGVPAAYFGWQRHIEKATALAREWTITGPPCPAISSQAYAAGPVKATESFALGEVSMGRGFGHVSCSYIASDGGRGLDDFPVCQFTSPGVLHVTTPKGEFYFAPGAGPATVSVPNGTPQCVMAGKFRG